MRIPFLTGAPDTRRIFGKTVQKPSKFASIRLIGDKTLLFDELRSDELRPDEFQIDELRMHELQIHDATGKETICFLISQRRRQRPPFATPHWQTRGDLAVLPKDEVSHPQSGGLHRTVA